MNKRKTLAGLGVLIIIVISAVAPSGALAEPIGTTAYTCKNTPGEGGFSDAHCLTEKAAGGYSQIEIGNGETTEIAFSNFATCAGTTTACPITLKGTTTKAFTMEILATEVSGIGEFSNTLVGGEHQVSGSAVIQFKGAVVLQPTKNGCVVREQKIETRKLKATTSGKGMRLNFAPAEGTVFAEVVLEKCFNSFFNGVYELKGSLSATPNGATIGFTHTDGTEQKSLTFGGIGTKLAALDSQITLKARTNSEEEFTPLALATAEAKEGFTASSYPATLSGNQAVQHALTVGTKGIECTEASFPATLSGFSSTFTVTPEYKNCRTDLNLPVTATMNGCSYVFHWAGETSISCPAGKKIVYHVFESEKKHLANEALCTYSIPAQGPLGEIVYENEGSGSSADILIKYKLAGISYEVEGPEGQCGSSASNGKYTGSTTEIAKNGKGEQIGLFRR